VLFLLLAGGELVGRALCADLGAGGGAGLPFLQAKEANASREEEGRAEGMTQCDSCQHSCKGNNLLPAGMCKALYEAGHKINSTCPGMLKRKCRGYRKIEAEA
jgi:hypothetical protein